MIKPTSAAVAILCFYSIALAQQQPAPGPGTGTGTGSGTGAGTGTAATPSPSPAAGAQAPPSPEQLKQMLANKQYKEVIQESTRILHLRPEAQAAYDKGQLLMTKGEAHLQLKQQGLAGQAFEQAAKEAKDPSDAAVAQATSTLIKKSPGMMYHPKAAAGAPAAPAVAATPAAGAAPAAGTAATPGLNIADPEQRKQAFASLFETEWVAAQPKIQSVKSQGSIPAFMKELEEISGLRAMEQAGTGSDTKTETALKDLGESAHEMIGQWVDQQSKHVDNIAEDVRKSAQSLGDGISTQRGLSAKETQDLRDIIANCDRLGPAMKSLSEASGAGAATAEPPAATSRPAQPPGAAPGRAGRGAKPEVAGARSSGNLSADIDSLKRRAEQLLNAEQSQVQRGSQGQTPGRGNVGAGGYGGQGQQPNQPRQRQ